MILYAVKHKHKELFLPWIKGSNSKAELADPKKQTPRLFKSYRAAALAMHSWVKGVQIGTGQWEYPDDPYASGGQYFVLESIATIHKRHRKLCDVCVAEISMHIKEID